MAHEHQTNTYDDRNFFQKLFKMKGKAEKQKEREASPKYQAIDTSKMHLVIKAKSKNAEQLEKAQKVARIVSLVVVYAFLIFMSLIVLFPFYWMIITSLKSTTEIRSLHQTFFPTNVLWSNYITVSRLPWYEFGVGKVEGWLTYKDSVFGSMIIPFWIAVFYIYLLRQNFKQIPNELYLAAKVDGKSDWQYLWKVMVPLAMPTLISIFILKLMGAWNSYVWPNLVTTADPSWRLVTNALRSSFTSSNGDPQYGIQMAATILVTVPLLLLFIFFRKYIMHGVGRAGIKG